ncbi:DUF761 DOMAIN PROTEIN [Salix purpurea]|uniref:DUF761 DOMAIN PROTEIN n=1 Tax=Salix purpurea TaxID=77065 RepID=A0A9Q0T2S3_SALPP|nr:DUF761 DOMAIN PROTEIN [Salix purpurea]
MPGLRTLHPLQVFSTKSPSSTLSSMKDQNPTSHAHHLTLSEPVLDGFSASHFYYDSTWNSVVPNEKHEHSTDQSQLSGYLHWLEQKVDDEDSTGTEKDINRLADLFIASCHEKFKLEKQESYRRFQDMMARSM